MSVDPSATGSRKPAKRGFIGGPVTTEFRDAKRFKRQTRLTIISGIVGIGLGIGNATWIAAKYWLDTNQQHNDLLLKNALIQKRAFFFGESLASEVANLNTLLKVRADEDQREKKPTARLTADIDKLETFALTSSLEQSLGVNVDLRKLLDQNVFNTPPQIDDELIPRAFYFILDEQFSSRVRETFELSYRLETVSSHLDIFMGTPRKVDIDDLEFTLTELEYLLPRLAKLFDVHTSPITSDIDALRKIPKSNLNACPPPALCDDLSDLKSFLEQKVRNEYERRGP